MPTFAVLRVTGADVPAGSNLSTGQGQSASPTVQGPDQRDWIGALIGAIGDAAFLIDGDHVRAVNDAAVRLLGATDQSGIAGARVDRVFDASTLHGALLAAPAAGGRPRRSPVVLRCLDGSRRTVDADLVLTKGRHGLLVVARQPEAITPEAADAFGQASVKDLIAGMAHELRTPLNAIIGFSEIIQEQMFGPLPDKYVSYARDIAQSGHHLLKIVNDILNYSRLERGETVFRRETTRADELITATVRLVAGQAEAHGISLSAQLPESLPMVSVDATKIKQVVINLLSNAIKFTPRGGRITVSAAMAHPRLLQITVADNGIGMSQAEAASALLPFRRLKQPVDGAMTGNGLGLPISLALLKLHGGTLQIASAPGTGTSIRCTIPV